MMSVRRIPTRTFDFRTFTSRAFDMITARARYYIMIIRYYFRARSRGRGEKELFVIGIKQIPKIKTKQNRRSALIGNAS